MFGLCVVMLVPVVTEDTRSSHQLLPGGEQIRNRQKSMICFERTELLSNEHWNCFKSNSWEGSEMRGGMCMSFPKCFETTLN